MGGRSQRKNEKLKEEVQTLTNFANSTFTLFRHCNANFTTAPQAITKAIWNKGCARYAFALLAFDKYEKRLIS